MIKNIKPNDIENKSFEIITEMLGDRKLDPDCEPIIKRVIHTTADFDYADNLVFSENVLKIAEQALKDGCDIVSDTNMVKAGINKAALAKLKARVHCFMSDEDVANEAKRLGVTRAAVSMQKAATLDKPCIFAIGNAPTALMKIKELYDCKKLSPFLVIGVPVGFVNVVESKEMIINSHIPHIVARGRKGGSNVAAAIVNALMYKITR